VTRSSGETVAEGSVSSGVTASAATTRTVTVTVGETVAKPTPSASV
jgi:hypothetical protein